METSALELMTNKVIGKNMATLEFAGRQDIANSLGAEIISAQEVKAFSRPPILIPRYSARLKRVGSPVRVEAFGKGRAAQIDDGSGLPTFAELLICERLRSSGWEAVWVSTFGGLRFVTSWPWNASLATERERLPIRIMEKIELVAVARSQRKNSKTTFGGIPDVIAWRNDDVIMIESKWADNDELGDSQEEWFCCAYDVSLSNAHLGVFEWYFEAT